MRFPADEMLTRLARLLRAAGYDTAMAPGRTPDEVLLEIARADGRILLTRDRSLAARAAPHSVLVAGRGAVEEARRLTEHLHLDWTLAPFTRCVMDNAALAEASFADIARMPPQAQALPGPFRVCPVCGRLYWPGSHVKRIGERLTLLAAARSD